MKAGLAKIEFLLQIGIFQLKNIFKDYQNMFTASCLMCRGVITQIFVVLQNRLLIRQTAASYIISENYEKDYCELIYFCSDAKGILQMF